MKNISQFELVHPDCDTSTNATKSSIRNLNNIELNAYLVQCRTNAQSGKHTHAKDTKAWLSHQVTSSGSGCAPCPPQHKEAYDNLASSLPSCKQEAARGYYERQKSRTTFGGSTTISPRDAAPVKPQAPTGRAQSARPVRGKQSTTGGPAKPPVQQYKRESSYAYEFALRPELRKVAERFNNRKQHLEMRRAIRTGRNPLDDGSLDQGLETEQRGNYKGSSMPMTASQRAATPPKSAGSPEVSAGSATAFEGGSGAAVECVPRYPIPGMSSPTTIARNTDASSIWRIPRAPQTARPATAGVSSTSKSNTVGKLDPTWMAAPRVLTHRKEKTAEQKKKEDDMDKAAVARHEAVIMAQVERGRKKMMTPSERMIAGAKAERAALVHYRSAVEAADKDATRKLTIGRPEMDIHGEDAASSSFAPSSRITAKPNATYLGEVSGQDRPVVHTASAVTRGVAQHMATRGSNNSKHDIALHKLVARIEPTMYVSTTSQSFSPRAARAVAPGTTIREGYIKGIGRRKPKPPTHEPNYPIF